MSYRVDRDAAGEVRVPESAYWGPATQRALDVFSTSTLTLPVGFIRAQGIVKRAAALGNLACRNLPPASGRAIVRAAEDVLEGGLNQQFVVDVFQDFSGAAQNQNANEVIANRAIELLGGQKGDYAIVDPGDHVNRAQATAGVTLSALHVAALEALTLDLMSALHELHDALSAKAKTFAPLRPAQDAPAIRLAPVFAGFADTVALDGERLKAAGQNLQSVPLGEGDNAPAGFQKEAVARLNDVSRLGYAAGPLNPNAVLNVSGSVRALTISLQKILVNLKTLTSATAQGALSFSSPLPNQPGAIVEMLCQVCVQVAGCDATVAQARQTGPLRPYGALPVMAWNLLHSIQILSNGIRTFSDRCLVFLTPTS